MNGIVDHPLRYQLANELHARPFPTQKAPGHVAYIAFKPETDAARRDRSLERLHLVALLDRYGAPHPQPDATHYSGQLGRYRLKWESHTEFFTYTLLADGREAKPFDRSAFDGFPEDWLAAAPGVRVTSSVMHIDTGTDEKRISSAMDDWLVYESLAAAWVLDRAVVVASDFRIDPHGHVRFVIFADEKTGERRIGRIIQRLCEIETYKAMSMFGLQRARELSSRLGPLASKLSLVVTAMNDEDSEAERVLHELLGISAELEELESRSSFRFGATGAYEAIVSQRIAVLREERFAGRQTFSEFMTRRFDPAIRTVRSTQTQLEAVSARALRAGELLRTKVDVARSAQNQALLESMDRRADMQLRLQQTVEGLSVVAISYYAVSLAGYLSYPFVETLGISKGNALAILTLPVVALVWLLVRRIRKRLGH